MWFVISKGQHSGGISASYSRQAGLALSLLLQSETCCHKLGTGLLKGCQLRLGSSAAPLPVCVWEVWSSLPQYPSAPPGLHHQCCPSTQGPGDEDMSVKGGTVAKDTAAPHPRLQGPCGSSTVTPAPLCPLQLCFCPHIFWAPAHARPLSRAGNKTL